ncbi:hypothetical protein BGX27_003887 [Mortierella sp. AM989]|nr:hypothetical protein BGX27_003887 [Mortierella sp. AM989]
MAMTIATCKSLAQQLEPILWKHLTIRVRQPARESLTRNCHIIESIRIVGLNDIFFENVLDILQYLSTTTGPRLDKETSTSCVTLKRLKRIELTNLIYASGLLTMFNYCPKLTYLDISCTMLLKDPNSARLFRQALSDNLRQLEHLRLNGLFATTKNVLPLLVVCFLHPQLKEMRFKFSMKVSGNREYSHWYEDDQEEEESQSDQGDEEFGVDPELRWVTTSLENASRSSDYSTSKISSLTLPSYRRGYPASFLVLLLRYYLPNIEAFDIPWGILDANLQEECPKMCFKLQHISFSQHEFHAPYELDAYTAEIKSFIIGCSSGVGLKSIRAYHFDEGDYHFVHDSLLGVVADNHSSTLEEVDFRNCQSVPSLSIQNILSTCRKLTRFNVIPASGSASVYFNHIVNGGQWVCLDLKELCLNLKRSSADYYDGTETELGKAEAKYVYSQIGRLVRLETLRLGYMGDLSKEQRESFELNLTLKDGWLAELQGLVELRHFHMASDFWSNMGQAETEFMSSHWPRLQTITVGSPLSWKAGHYEQQPHWQRLRDRKIKFLYN